MSPEIANPAANPNHCTGPITEEGKSISSRNALTTGLYAARDFIRSGEEDEYNETAEAFMLDLNPEGAMEQLFAGQIVTSNWRLRRCDLVEEALAACLDRSGISSPDAAEIEIEKQQQSVDRARAQCFRNLSRCTSELRKLQTERHTRVEVEIEANWGLAETSKIYNVLKLRDQLRATNPAQPDAADEEGIGEFKEVVARLPTLRAASFRAVLRCATCRAAESGSSSAQKAPAPESARESWR